MTTNATNTAAFLAVITPEARALILGSIARHYGVTESEIYAEVTDPEAEHLLDYMTGGERTAASVLMQKHRFA